MTGVLGGRQLGVALLLVQVVVSPPEGCRGRVAGRRVFGAELRRHGWSLGSTRSTESVSLICMAAEGSSRQGVMRRGHMVRVSAISLKVGRCCGFMLQQFNSSRSLGGGEGEG